MARRTTHSNTYGGCSNSTILQQSRGVPGYGTASVFASSMNLVNAMMGAGIIGLPLALRFCGFWFGMLVSVLVAVLTSISVHLTILCGIRTSRYTLVDLYEACLLGRSGAHIVNFLLFFHTAGTTVSYYILLGDTLPGLINNYILSDISYVVRRDWVIIGFGLCCSLPLCLPRSMAPLAKWSTMGIALLPVMVIGVLVRVPIYAPPDIELNWINLSQDMFKGLAIMGLSFGCSQNVFGVYLSQHDQRPSSFLTANVVAIGIGYIVNMLFAVLGYISFGKLVKANVLLNYPENDPVINAVRLALGLFMILTIPTCIYPCRESLQKMMGQNTNGRVPTNREHYTVTLALFTLILYFGVTLTSVGKVFDILGGFTTTLLSFLLPGAAYIAIFFPELIAQQPAIRTPLLIDTEDQQKKEFITGSWPLLFIALVLVIISLPIIYFAAIAPIFE